MAIENLRGDPGRALSWRAAPTPPLLASVAVLAAHLLVAWSLGGAGSGAVRRAAVFDGPRVTLVPVRPMDGGRSSSRYERGPSEPGSPFAVGRQAESHASSIDRHSAALEGAAGRSASPAAGIEPAGAAQAVSDTPADARAALPILRGYLPSQALDRPALPRSAPDEAVLAGVLFSGLPIKLRLFIDAGGSVVDVETLQSSEDEQALQQLRSMFLATLFIAGRHQGVDVASYKDVEISSGEPR